MEQKSSETLIQELRALTTKLNNLKDYVRSINEQLQKSAKSEDKLYNFLATLVDKLLQHQERKKLS